MRRLQTALLGVGAVIVALWLLDPRPQPQADKRLRLATTTSTANSGLLSYLLEPFERQTGLTVQVIAVGTGQALALGRRGDCDLVLVHAREAEDEFVAQGYGVDRRNVMYNDFVILGPCGDPAGVRAMTDPAAALEQILARGQSFLSRGDDSGTHIRERALWRLAHVEPEGHAGYVKAGDGMARCLEIANQKGYYILSDRGTYLALERALELSVLVQGHESLHNPYGVMRVNPALHPHVHAEGALRLMDYLTSEQGQARIGAYQVAGEALFHPLAQE